MSLEAFPQVLVVGQVAMARVRSQAGFNNPNAVETPIAYDTIDYQRGQVTVTLAAGASPVRTRITAVLAGLYVVTAGIVFTSNATGTRSLIIMRNGTGEIIERGRVPSAAAQTGITIAGMLVLAVGDYLESAAYSDNGSPLGAFGGAYNFLAAARLPE